MLVGVCSTAVDHGVLRLRSAAASLAQDDKDCRTDDA